MKEFSFYRSKQIIIGSDLLLKTNSYKIHLKVAGYHVISHKEDMLFLCSGKDTSRDLARDAAFASSIALYLLCSINFVL